MKRKRTNEAKVTHKPAEAAAPGQPKQPVKRGLVRLKREQWRNYCIPCPERRRLLREINDWLSDVVTDNLPIVLCEVARLAHDDPPQTPFRFMEIDADYDDQRFGYVVVKDDEAIVRTYIEMAEWDGFHSRHITPEQKREFVRLAKRDAERVS